MGGRLGRYLDHGKAPNSAKPEKRWVPERAESGPHWPLGGEGGPPLGLHLLAGEQLVEAVALRGHAPEPGLAAAVVPPGLHWWRRRRG